MGNDKTITTDNYIFSEQNLTEICNIQHDKIDILRNNSRYKNLENEIVILANKISEKLDDDSSKDLNMLISTLTEMENYSNALFYSLGIKYGTEIYKL